MGCHTLLGEGAYYAPDLTKVVERRGATWIDVFLDDPQAMFPGERKMVKYNFTKEEKGQVIAFLDWVGKIDANGWPPKPNIPIDSIVTSPAPQIKSNVVALSQPEKFSQLCVACHAVGGKGGNVGPALDHVGSKFDSDYLNRWLSDPQAIKPGTNMPKLPLTDPERKDIVTYLSALK